MDFTLVEFYSLYYLHFVNEGWVSHMLYDNHRFIKDFPKSNNGWHLSWILAINAYDVAYLELGATNPCFVPSDELSL